MKLGVLTNMFPDKTLDETLGYLKSLGVEIVEINSGGYGGTCHADPKVLLNNSQALEEFKATFKKHDLGISAFSCHGNCVHPDKAVAKEFQDAFEATVLLAEAVGVHQINTFSGCPGGSAVDITPNWITCPWPTDFTKTLDYQWNDVLIPYWKKAVSFAKSHGVNKIALELHPGFCVYNSETLLRLRAAVGPEIGANLDPSHLFWQGMDIPTVIRELGESIFHFHAKDSKVYEPNARKNGVLDTKNYTDEINRSWIFRAVGYGHSYEEWNDIISTLRLVGYDHAISIEHEDSLMSSNEGLEKAVKFLQQVIIKEGVTEAWWA